MPPVNSGPTRVMHGLSSVDYQGLQAAELAQPVRNFVGENCCRYVVVATGPNHQRLFFSHVLTKRPDNIMHNGVASTLILVRLYEIPS
jgi:hypothetical protein